MILIIENNKIIILFNLNNKNIKKIINNIKNKKIIKLNKNNINKNNKINKINKNIIIINNKKNRINELVKYLKISDEIIFYIIPNFNNIKKNYFILNKIENKYKINKNKVKLIIEKNNDKNKIYYLIVRNIFKRYLELY